MKIPKPVKYELTLDPGFHLTALRHTEGLLDDLLKSHPSPNQANTPGMEGEFSGNIAENYESFLSLRNMLSQAAEKCDSALCEAAEEGNHLSKP